MSARSEEPRGPDAASHDSIVARSAPGTGAPSEAEAAEIESELAAARHRALDWRRLAIQSLAFLVGVALIVWIVSRAARDPTVWQRLRSADPGVVAALLGCSVASLLLNGAIFWVAVQPVRRLGMAELQWVNAFAALVNYAPVRLGLLVRIVWHLRVDRMHVREVVAWFVNVTYTVLVPLGAAITASLLIGALDGWLVALTVGLIAVGAVAAPRVARLPFVARRCGGLERVITDRRALVGALTLRTLDLVCWTLRVVLAVRILGIDLTPGQSVMVAMASLAMSLFPTGQLGIREATVAFLAARMAIGDPDALDSQAKALAVVESASQFAVTLPAGVLAAFMLARRWRRAKQARASRVAV